MALQFQTTTGQAFGPAGPNHSPGLVPDPGSVTSAVPNVLGSDAAWHGLGGLLSLIGPLGVALGGTGLASVSTGAVLLGAGLSAFSLAAPAGAGQVLTSNGVGVDPSFQNAAAQNFALLNTLTASNSASLADTTSLTNTYSLYMVSFYDVVPATAGEPLEFQVSINGGTSYVATGYAGGNYNAQSGGAAGASTQPTTAIGLTCLTGASTNAGEGVSGVFFIFNFQGGLFGAFGVCNFIDSAANSLAGWYGSTVVPGGTVNAIKFFQAAGNITSGTIKIYGIT